MAIQSGGEAHIILTNIVLKVDRYIETAPRNDSLAGAKRSLGVVADAVKQGKKLTLMQLQGMQKAAEAIRAFSNEEKVADDLYDLEDFFAAQK
jgi:hypothetical protein